MNAGPASADRRLRRVLLALAGLALLIGFLALGTWQLERRSWKLALIERVYQRVHAAPVAPPGAERWYAVNAAQHEYLPVALQGRWLHGKTVLTQAVTESGPGFWVLSALQQPDGTQVLVNRGFVPQAQRTKWLDGGAATAEPEAALRGLLRMAEPGGGFLRSNDPAQQRWYSRDVAAIAQALQLPHAAPYFVDAGLPGDPQTTPARWPQAGMTVIEFRNTHLVYALTWYGLALMVAVAFWYVARYERRLDRLSRGSPQHPTR